MGQPGSRCLERLLAVGETTIRALKSQVSDQRAQSRAWVHFKVLLEAVAIQGWSWMEQRILRVSPPLQPVRLL